MSRREHFSSKLGFFFAAIGSAVGLGVLWKFPYTVGENGGGLFLLSYVVCTILIGIPVFIAELMLGRKAQRAAVGVFEELEPSRPSWKIAGWLGVISSFIIMSFYSVIAGWGVSYVVMSLTGFAKGMSATEVQNTFFLLERSGDISLLWHFLFTMMTMFIVFSGVRQGIEHWSKIMTRGLFVIMFFLFLYSLRLDGIGEACRFIFYPNVDSFKFSSILEALGLAFFTLSLGQGIMFSYGSYTKENDDLPLMATVVAFAVIIVALLAALIVFPIVFSFHFEPAAGTGLIFQVLPFLFEQLPGGMVISTVFFILFVFTAITSSIAFIEVVATNLMELVGWSRRKAVVLVAAGTFIFGIPSALSASRGMFADWQAIYRMNFLDTMNSFVSVWLIPVGGLVTTLFVGWVWDRDVARKEFYKGCHRRGLFWVWYYCMRYLVPLLILIIIIQKSGLIDVDAWVHR